MPPVGLAWAYGVLAAVLIAASVTDIRCGKIHNVVTYPAVFAGLVGHTVVGGLMGDGGRTTLGLAGAALGLAVGFGPLLLVWLAGGIGGGDAKLMAAVGALTGWNFTIRAMFCGFLVAALMAVFVMVRLRIVRRTLGRIFRSIYLALVPGKGAVGPPTTESPKIAFGLALCIGSAVALVDTLLGGPMALRLLVGM